MKILGYDPYVNKDNFKDKEIEIVEFEYLIEKAILLHCIYQ